MMVRGSARALGEVGAHKTEVVVVMVVIVAACCLICMLFVSFRGLVDSLYFVGFFFVYGAHAKGLNRHALENLEFCLYLYLGVFCFPFLGFNIMGILMSLFLFGLKVEKIGIKAMKMQIVHMSVCVCGKPKQIIVKQKKKELKAKANR